MEDAKWERYAALGGIAFVVCNVVGSFLPGSPPSTDDSATKIAAYFKDNAGSIKVAQLLGGLGMIGLLWWFGSLWRMMNRAEGERSRLAIVAAVSLGIGGTLAMISGALTSATALRIGTIGEGAEVFFILSLVVISTAGFAIVAFLSAVCALNYRTKMLPAWTSYVGWVAALLFLVSTGGAASDANAFGLLGLGGFLVWCVWIVAVSILMWRREPATAS